MFSKLSKISAIIVAVGIIMGATITCLSYEFVKKEELAIQMKERDVKISKIETDQTRVIQKLDDVATDVRDIKKILLHK